MASTDEGRYFTLDRARMFDIAATSRVAAMLQERPRAAWDDAWHLAFRRELWWASVVFPPAEQSPIADGPDGMAYFRAALPVPGTPFEAQSIGNALPVCFRHSTGLVLLPAPEARMEDALYTFTFGDLDNLWRFDGTARKRPDIPFETGEGISIGRPSADILPPHLARALHWHVTAGWRLPAPRIAAFAREGCQLTLGLGAVPDDLVRVEPAMRARAFDYLRWYLPPNLSLVGLRFRPDEAMAVPLASFFEDAPPDPPAPAATPDAGTGGGLRRLFGRRR